MLPITLHSPNISNDTSGSGKKESIHVRVSPNLKQSVLEMVNKSDEYRSISHLVSPAIRYGIDDNYGFVENQMDQDVSVSFDNSELTNRLSSLEDQIEEISHYLEDNDAPAVETDLERAEKMCIQSRVEGRSSKRVRRQKISHHMKTDEAMGTKLKMCDAD